jgi:hypothetical protein
MSISNYAENKILEHTTGEAAWTMPTNVYVKLHTGDPGEDATSNAATETTRKEASFAAASSGSIATDATLGMDERCGNRNNYTLVFVGCFDCG